MFFKKSISLGGKETGAKIRSHINWDLILASACTGTSIKGVTYLCLDFDKKSILKKFTVDRVSSYLWKIQHLYFS